MKIMIAGGTGFIGQALVKHFLQQQADITVVGRNIAKIDRLFANSVRSLSWQQLTVYAVRNVDVIINLSGAGIGDKRWTPARKQEILISRIIPTQTLSRLCAQLKEQSPILLNASAVGVYGLQPTLSYTLPPALSETTPIDFDKLPDFLAAVGRKWELATHPARDAGVRVVNMRFGVVLGQGGVLAKLKLPFLFGFGGVIGTGQQAFSWISLFDLIRAIDFLITQNDIKGAVNLTSPHCVTQKQFAETLARTLHRPSFMLTPACLLTLLFGEMAQALLKGQHVSPYLLQKAGFQFSHPDIQSALTTIKIA
jgi:uncharacterized protein (TIGR01777 family)